MTNFAILYLSFKHHESHFIDCCFEMIITFYSVVQNSFLLKIQFLSSILVSK